MITPLTINRIVKNIPHSVKSADFPLSVMNLADVEGIQKGITLFDDGNSVVPMDDIAFLTKKLATFNLFRGCDVGCSHCFKDAKQLPKDMHSILFEDIERFAQGIKALSERFGFNVLQGQKFLRLFDDSNPGDYAIRGLNREHNISEAVKVLLDKIKVPITYATSGWNKKSQASQEELAKVFSQNPESLSEIGISVNPFSGIMENSRKALKSGDIERANKYRELYIDRIANAFVTFFELFKGEKPKGYVIYKHAHDYAGNELVGEKETRKLYIEIYDKMKKILGDRLSEAPILNPSEVTKFRKSHLIEASGRGRRYFPYDYNLDVQSGLISDIERWNSMNPQQRRAFLDAYSLRSIDIDGKVYVTYPALDTSYVYFPYEVDVPMNIQLNYINRPNVPKIFSDIEVEV